MQKIGGLHAIPDIVTKVGIQEIVCKRRQELMIKITASVGNYPPT